MNEGFESLFVAYEKGGDGAVVITNAQGGTRLAEAMMRGVAVAYGWPDFKPTVRTAVSVSPAVLNRYVGVDAPVPQVSLTVTLEGDRLMLEAPRWSTQSLNSSWTRKQGGADGCSSGRPQHQCRA